nr:hypothetical protein [Bacteroidota bacterium]
YTEVPQNMAINHNPILYSGESVFTVVADEGALIALTVNGEIIGVAVSTGGATNITIEPQLPPNQMIVTVTKQDYFRYEATVDVIPPEGPYVVGDSFVINDASGNNNGMMDYGESITLNMTMKNVGVEQAQNVNVTMTSSDPYVTITDGTQYFGNIDPDGTVTINDAFALDCDENIPDNHTVSFELSSTDGTDVWISYISIKGHAPKLEYVSYSINDSGGNNNGFLDPGETAAMTVTVENGGSADAYDVVAQLTSSDPMLVVLTTQPQNIGDLSPDATGEATFNVFASPDIVPGYVGELSILFTADMGVSQSDVIHIPFADYCEATTNTEDEWIYNVLCGDIDNTSGWQGGVADYTDQSTVINQGMSQDIVVTNGNAWASDIVYVWVDWNDNFEFELGGEEEFQLVNVGGTGETFEGAITTPAGAANGDHRMRVRMTYSTAPVPCGSASYGEVEDYTIEVGGTPILADVGVYSIDIAGVLAPGPVTPKVTVKNFGLDAQTFPVTLDIGGYSSTMTVTSLAGGATEQVTFATWNAAIGSYTADACTELVGDEDPSNDCKTKGLVVQDAAFVYAYNAYDPSGTLVEGPISFDLGTPGTLTLLAPTTSSDFIAGGCWANDTWYGGQYGGGLYTIDPGSGDMTFIGNSPDCSGLAWDGTTLYGASITDLYAIDPATGSGTMIGGMGNPSGLMIAIGCDAAGNLYGYDIGDDNFFSINKTSGAATIVGPLGYNFNYAQDMSFDKATGVCYLSGYTTQGELYTVDVATGAATLVGAFQGGCVVTAFAIPSEAGPGLNPPLNLAGSFVAPNSAVLTWDPPIQNGEYIHWDNGTNYDGIGLANGGDWMVAARFETGDLAAYDGQYLTKVKIFPRSTMACDYILKVWTGANAGTLVVSEMMTSLVMDEWNDVYLTAPHEIDAGQELWIGYAMEGQQFGDTPAGIDEGPAVAGYGDLFSFNGNWDLYSNYGQSRNWNIQGFVIDEVDGATEPIVIVKSYYSNTNPILVKGNLKAATQSELKDVRGLLGYNVYRDGSQINGSTVTALEYTDGGLSSGTYSYTVKALYDEGLSPASQPVTVIIPEGNPVINVEPGNFNFNVDFGGSSSDVMMVQNLGDGTLDYDITVEY